MSQDFLYGFVKLFVYAVLQLKKEITEPCESKNRIISAQKKISSHHPSYSSCLYRKLYALRTNRSSVASQSAECSPQQRMMRTPALGAPFI